MRLSLFLFILIFITTSSGCGDSDSSSDTPVTDNDDTDTDTQIPNILLIISDDQGLDASAQYSFSSDLPYTPTLDKLAQDGIIFDNAWATPSCTTTRGAIISGMHGVNSGVDTVPNRMSTDTNTIQRALANDLSTESITNAVFGKWHIAGSTPDLDHPQQSGINHYYGNIKGNLTDYELWDTVTNGVEGTSMTYHSTDITDKAIDWISLQNSPWFAWVAYSAPHSPFHLPPEELHSRDLSGTEDDIENNKRDYFLTAIEAMDTEIGRLIESLDDTTRENTLIIYLGDNGTPRAVVDTAAFIKGQTKNTLYEGGIRVPMVVSGARIQRSGTRESALVNAVDIFPTILSATGAEIPTNIDGHSFYELLSDSTASKREFNYSEFVSDDLTGWTVSNGLYKLIVEENGDEQLFYLNDNLFEDNNLLDSSNTTYESIANHLSSYGSLIRESSANTDEAEDITDVILESTDISCTNYAANYRSEIEDVNNEEYLEGSLSISVDGEECVFNTNQIPNHNVNDGTNSYRNDTTAIEQEYRIPVNPTFASSNSALLISQDDGILLSGAKVDVLAASCYGVSDGLIGCADIDQPWRYDPIHENSAHTVDLHNAHSQANGAYHYHGYPNALYNEDSASVVIGFAADGFPIHSGYISESGVIRKVTSSYGLKSGERADTGNDPGGSHDGTFRDDYEYVEDLGDLDECNGMTWNGSYGYYIVDSFPYTMSCFKGTPDSSFNK